MDDFQSIGIDADGGAAFALVPGSQQVQGLFVLPLLDQAKFLDTMQRLMEDKEPAKREAVLKAGRPAYAVFHHGAVYIGFQQRGLP